MLGLLYSRSFRLSLQGAAFVVILWWIYLIFADGSLDESVAALFFVPGPTGNWPMADQWWVKLAYHGIPIFTSIWGLGTIAVFAAGYWSHRFRKWRSISLFCLLLLGLGPGVLVNAILKDHWGRPRPRDTVTFNGTEAFQAAYVRADHWGKSFPCGHCSIGVSLCAFALWNRRRRNGRRVSHVWWAVSIGFGAYLGVARMASGGHYLSDVLVSGVLIVGLAWVLDSFLPSVRWEREEGCESETQFPLVSKGRLLFPSLLLSAGCLTAAGLAFPYDRAGVIELNLASAVIEREPEAQRQHRNADRVQVESTEPSIRWRGPEVFDSPNAGNLRFVFHAKGFGFPWSEVEVVPTLVRSGCNSSWIVDFGVTRTGYFKELKVEIEPYP